jgi:hypothetical protein
VQLCVFGQWKRARRGPQSFPRDATGSARASGDVPVFTDFHWKKRKMKIDCGSLKFFFTPWVDFFVWLV